jgi:phosphatidylserine/phosphatidylglycerophosphate/cardiolipin synthase-like enzyme
LVNLIGAARPGATLYTENEQLDSTPVEQALVADAAKGVTVDVVMTYSCSYGNGFDTLVAGGVHVHLYYSQTPHHIQAKALSVNGKTVYVGSINYVTSSTNDDRNMGIITTDPTVVPGTTTTTASDFAGATPYNPSSSDSGSLSTTTAACRTPAPTSSG